MVGRTMITVSVLGVLMFCGCASQVRLALQFPPEHIASYRVTTEMVKDYRFEQPSAEPPKVQENQSATVASVTFDQRIDKVADDGSALATITVKALQYKVTEKDVTKYDFDSTAEAAASKPLSKVIGQSYTIRISPQGTVEVVDAEAIRKAVPATTNDGRVAGSLFNDENIIKRHSIVALPDASKATVAVGDTWTRVEPSPPGLLAPKSYEKVYTLEKVEGPKEAPIAYVTMTATESPEPAEGGQQSPGMGFMAKMFDTQETYTGSMVFDCGTGRVRSLVEKLAVKYIAAEAPANQKPDVGPDTLTMGLTYTTKVETLN